MRQPCWRMRRQRKEWHKIQKDEQELISVDTFMNRDGSCFLPYALCYSWVVFSDVGQTFFSAFRRCDGRFAIDSNCDTAIACLEGAGWCHRALVQLSGQDRISDTAIADRDIIYYNKGRVCMDKKRLQWHPGFFCSIADWTGGRTAVSAVLRGV